MGPVRTWIHRTLSGISDERVLQKVLLRLMQAEFPLFVQLRHGMAEYGKDIVKLAAVDDRNTLKVYQVKAGNIDIRKWRDSRNELEDMFHADMSDVQLPAKTEACEGILIFNGHIHPLTEPLVEGWLEEQERDHGRTFTIMGLDSIVTWIVNNRLTSELRAVLSELGISIVQLCWAKERLSAWRTSSDKGAIGAGLTSPPAVSVTALKQGPGMVVSGRIELPTFRFSEVLSP